MQIHRNIEKLPNFHDAVITTGTFDGVHAGHLTILEQLKNEAAEINGESIVITFDPHPRLVLQALHRTSYARDIQLLTTLEEKIDLLAWQDIDHLVVVPFTEDFSNQEPEAYISDFIVNNFQPKVIITGFDHKFGKDRKGDYKLLEKYSSKFGYKVKEIPEYVLKHIIVSSTKIRKALESGDIETANACLGYSYFLSGSVIHGHQLGRALGYPTANLGIANTHKLVPAYGIYAVEVNFIENPRERSLPGMMSIGIRPTLDDNHPVAEVHIFDYDENIYGKTIKVNFIKYTRPEIKFENLEALKIKMQEDEREIRAILSGEKS